MNKDNLYNIIDDIMLSNATMLNNTVIVDIGDSDGLNSEQILPDGSKIYIDNTYSEYDTLRRSGKVLAVPNGLAFHKPYKTHSIVENILVEVGDTVFFQPETRDVAKRDGLIFKTPEGNHLFAIPYSLLICAVKQGAGVVMLNGNVLVKRNLDHIDPEFKSDFIYIEKTFNNAKYNWCDVVSANNDENYKSAIIGGVACDMVIDRQKFEHVKNGSIVFVKKYGSFNIQSAISGQSNGILTDTFSVRRSDVVAVRQTEQVPIEFADPYGFYVKIKLEETDADKYYDESKLIIRPKPKKQTYSIGVIQDIGSGVHSFKKGDRVMFHGKGADEIGGYIYAHQMWIIQKLR